MSFIKLAQEAELALAQEKAKLDKRSAQLDEKKHEKKPKSILIGQLNFTQNYQKEY